MVVTITLQPTYYVYSAGQVMTYTPHLVSDLVVQTEGPSASITYNQLTVYTELSELPNDGSIRSDSLIGCLNDKCTDHQHFLSTGKECKQLLRKGEKEHTTQLQQDT